MEYRVRKRDVSGGGRLPHSLEDVLPNATIRRFLLRAGFRSSSDRAADEVRRHVSDFFRRIVGCTVVMMQHDGRRSLRLIDVKRACEHFGIRMYGYDDMFLLAAGRERGPEAYHVTELVESKSLFSQPINALDEPDTEPGGRYFKKTNFVANYMSWKEELGEMEDDDVSEPSEWSFSSSSDTEVEEDQEMTRKISQPWKTDEEKFIASLRDAQAFADDRLLQEKEDEEGNCESEPGQGYYSDYDDTCKPEYLERQQTRDEHEDTQWNKIGDLHLLQEREDSDPAELLNFSRSPNVYVISRQDFLRIFRTLLGLTLRMGELHISSVALSALHNATEQCLHRSLTEGSLHYQLSAILKEQEYVHVTSQLESELRMQREKVNELCETIAANKSAFKAKELAMQQQIEKYKKEIQGQHDVRMQTPPSLKKKASAKKRSTSKKAHDVRKGQSKSSNGSTSIIGALRSRDQNSSSTKKKVKVSLV
ncbi:hypothetical protein PsorP6_000316 [Peronosclerospora sorghi]|uniref:Uncharacterized protein n=1 Tax=Peronosclerospora sorghi TaxID=230839 RepID=A0ACC0WVW0_9STRA|nr:hypothetical protein PsorP6_000316 [Peronosclerospora sorghi]